MRRRALAALLAAVLALALVVGGASVALAFGAAEGERELASIEGRWTALTQAARRDAKALAELDRRASALAADASRGLAAQREDAAERDADMAAVVAGHEWQATEALLLELRFRIAAIQLERALAGDPERVRLARAAAEGFGSFVDAPDPALAAEARYGRGLARIAAGDRVEGLADLRAAASERTVAPRARLALAENLADAGERTQALDVVTRQLAAGGMTRDLTLRAKLLRLKLVLGTGAKAANVPDLAPLVADLLAAGDPWRANALALVQGHEELLPSGADVDASVLLLRADAAARRDDAAGALALYRQAVARGGAKADPAALDGLARSALAAGSWAEARSAVARLRKDGRPETRELALIDLRAAYGAWQAVPDAASLAALAGVAELVGRASGATADDRAEAAYRKAEAARGAGDLDGAIVGFVAIDAPSWQAAAGVAALQARVLRYARDPGLEPRDALLGDLGAAMARDKWPADARATIVVLDATVRTTPPSGSPPPAPLEAGQQRAALERLREFPKRFPDASALLPAALRARVLLEIDGDGNPDPAMLDVLPAELRPAVAAAIADDLREEATSAAEVVRTAPGAAKGSNGSSVATEAVLARGRRAITGALAFAALTAEPERSAGRLDLAQSALVLGDAATAVALFRAEADAQPKSLRALRGLALAAQVSGDPALAGSAWDRLAAIPDLPPAVREEVERARAPRSSAGLADRR